MNTNLLFALDKDTDEIIVSESPKGSIKINFIERVKRKENIILYNAVETLTSLANASSFDKSIFNSMEKVCQMIYFKYKETT